jgi:hypothetical protein
MQLPDDELRSLSPLEEVLHVTSRLSVVFALGLALVLTIGHHP